MVTRIRFACDNCALEIGFMYVLCNQSLMLRQTIGLLVHGNLDGNEAWQAGGGRPNNIEAGRPNKVWQA